jgi:hypothetical protein
VIVAGKGRDRKVLRERLVLIEEGFDPDNPRRKVRRAVRVDPLIRLERCGSISEREADAAQALRDCLESLSPRLGVWCSGSSSAHYMRSTPPLDRIVAAGKVRRAAEALNPQAWAAVLWICLGGSVLSYARRQKIRDQLAGEIVREALTALADHWGT